jgi:hypothetical protein
MEESDGSVFCRIGALGALLLLVCSVITLVLVVAIGGPPATAEEAFALLQRNRLAGLLRLDILTAVSMPAYYALFAGLYAALQRTHRVYTILAAVLAFIGVTLFLSTPSVLSIACLSDQHLAATTEARRAALVAAGEALLASDMWHSTAAFVGGILLETACLLISVVMLRGAVFSKATGYVGVATHGLDLGHILAGLFAPTAGFVLMAAAGPLYLVWFLLVGGRLWRLGRATPAASAARPAAGCA